MGTEERWTATCAIINFNEMLVQLITARKPAFIDGGRKGAMLLSMDEWSLTQEKIMHISVPDL